MYKHGACVDICHTVETHLSTENGGPKSPQLHLNGPLANAVMLKYLKISTYACRYLSSSSSRCSHNISKWPIY